MGCRLEPQLTEQNEYFIKILELYKKKQTQILEPWSSINEIKNELVGLGNRTDHMEDRTSDTTDINP